MTEFKIPEISDKLWAKKILDNFYCPSYDYNFTTMYIWRKAYNIQIMEHNGFLLGMYGTDKKSFLFPAGNGDIKKEIEFLASFAKSMGQPLRIGGINPDTKKTLEELFPNNFKFTERRNSSDYIYESESLKTLTGKKLSAKRNHINRFVENFPDWRYEKITKDNMKYAIDMHVKWCELNGCTKSAGLLDECFAISEAFKYFDELELSGGMLIADNRVFAFSIGDKLNSDTFLVHIEKAFSDIQGAYPMINKHFVINNCENFKYVNREEDLGEEGLRKAKLSYQPYNILQKFSAVWEF